MDKRDKAQTILRHHLRIVVFNDDYLNLLTQVCLTRMRRAAFDMAAIVLVLAGQALVGPRRTLAGFWGRVTTSTQIRSKQQ